MFFPGPILRRHVTSSTESCIALTASSSRASRCGRSPLLSRRAKARRASTYWGGDRGAAPFPAPLAPGEAFASATLRISCVFDQAPAQSKGQRRYAPNTVHLRPGMPFAFPSESAFTFGGIRTYAPDQRHHGTRRRIPIGWALLAGTLRLQVRELANEASNHLTTALASRS